MRYHPAAAALFAAVIVAIASRDAGAQTSGAPTPRTLPAVSGITMPAFTHGTALDAHLRRMQQRDLSIRRTSGEEPMLQGDAATLAQKRDELGRMRAAESARIRALHLPGVNADPR
jgi:hypothetical protein